MFPFPLSVLQVDVAEICGSLQGWMLAQIPGGAMGLISSCATTRHSAARIVRPTVAAVRSFFSQVTLYSRPWWWPFARPLRPPVNLTSVPYWGVLATMDLDGVFDPGRRASYPEHRFFGSSRSKGATSSSQ